MKIPKLASSILAIAILPSYVAAQSGTTGDCFASLQSNQDLTRLGQKVSLNPLVEPSFSMLTNAQFIQAAEKPILVQWVERISECVKTGRQYRADGHTLTARQELMIEEFKNGIEIAALKLFEKKFTFADFSKRHKELIQEASTKYQALLQDGQRQMQDQAKATAEAKARADEQARIKRREQSAQEARDAAQEAQAAAQARALATAQRIANCRSARETMTAMCKAVDDPNSGININIGNQVSPMPKWVSPFEFMECSKWKDEVSRVCRQ